MPDVVKPIPNQSFSFACCYNMQRAAQNDFVDLVDMYHAFLIKVRSIDEGDGYIAQVTAGTVELVFCPFCGARIREEGT
jgi:hypothetical protein